MSCVKISSEDENHGNGVAFLEDAPPASRIASDSSAEADVLRPRTEALRPRTQVFFRGGKTYLSFPRRKGKDVFSRR